MLPRLITPPAEYPVHVSELREHLRLEPGVEGNALQMFIAAATAQLDGYSGILGRCLIDQTWRLDFADWSCLRLPFPDCRSAVVVWRDAAGVATTVAAQDYWLEETAFGVVVRFVSGWSAPTLPTGGAAPVSVTFVAGYGAVSDVPFGIRQAILMQAGHFYRYRESGTDEAVTTLPLAYDALIAPHRVML